MLLVVIRPENRLFSFFFVADATQVYVRSYGGTQSADLDAVLRNNNLTHYAK